jgi:predicted dienelactone hydrolase
VKLTRHAKNKARWLGVTRKEIENVIAAPLRRDADSNGKPRYEGWVRDIRVRAVVALDEPDLIVTIQERRS